MHWSKNRYQNSGMELSESVVQQRPTVTAHGSPKTAMGPSSRTGGVKRENRKTACCETRHNESGQEAKNEHSKALDAIFLSAHYLYVFEQK
jgi:hypothetical protein